VSHQASKKTPAKAPAQHRGDVFNAFCFEGAERQQGASFTWHKHCAAELMGHLNQAQGKTLTDLTQNNRSHFLNGTGFSKEAATAMLRKGDQFDYDKVFSLRVGGTERIIGTFGDGIFEVLWWDPDHQFYPSYKKHT
jgi:hypothetical protein